MEQTENRNGTDLEQTGNLHSKFVPDPHSLLAPTAEGGGGGGERGRGIAAAK